MIRLIAILLLLPLSLCGQFYHFVQPDTFNVAAEPYTGLYQPSGGSATVVADGIDLGISSGNAFSVEIWQYLPSRQTGKELLRLETTDTSGHYFGLRLNSSAYVEAQFVNTAGTFRIDTEDEEGSSPKEYSGVVESKDWYHIVFARSTGGTNSLYIDGEAVTFHNTTGTFKNVYGLLKLTLRNLAQVGPVRLFSSALTEDQAETLYNAGIPLLSTNIANLELEWTHENDVWTGSSWTVTDDSGNGHDGTTTGFNYRSLRPIQNLDHQQRRGGYLDTGVPYFITWNVAADYYNTTTAGRIRRPWNLSPSMGPKVWYDPPSNRTYVFANDHGGHGGNREGLVFYYDHTTRQLSEGVKVGHVTAGIVDDHPSLSGVVYQDTIFTIQEDGHNTPLYARFSADGETFIQSAPGGPSTNAYPSLYLAGGVVYCISRVHASSNANGNYIYTYSNGAWSATREIIDFPSGDWAYKFEVNPSIDNEKIIHYSLKREAGQGPFYRLALMLSNDGRNWHNIDSSYNQNVTASGSIDDTDYLNYQFHKIDTVTINQSAYPAGLYYLDGKHMAFTLEYDTLTTGVDFIRLYYSDGITGFRVKNNADLITAGAAAVVHEGGDTYSMFSGADDLVRRFVTTDFFDTVTEAETIYSGPLDISILGVTENQTDADEVVVLGYGVNEGLEDHLMIYIYDKTQ